MFGVDKVLQQRDGAQVSQQPLIFLAASTQVPQGSAGVADHGEAGGL